MKRMIRRPALALASLCLGACMFGGTGTDTENGITDTSKDKTPIGIQIKGVSARVVDGEGRPIKGVTLNLFQPGFRPDSGNAQATGLVDTAKSMVSDSLGYVTVPLMVPGKFVIEGVSGGQTLFFDTLAVIDIKTAAPFTFRARAQASFKGRVRLASGMRIDTGFVFIRGTSRAVKVDSAGGYNLGTLPADVGRMAVGMRFSSSPTSVQEAILTHVDSASNKSVYTCKDVPKDSTARLATIAGFDKAVSDTAMPVTKLDTSKVNTALMACDTLSKGSVINVVGGGPGPSSMTGAKDSVPVIVLQSSMPVSTVSGTRTIAAYVVPYACVPYAGMESTSFQVQLLPTGTGSDILVKDVSQSCLLK
ncbi:MAG: hypothetical protein JWP91_3728 [Fibrobacteres bacterium]|nr:hypothetical protein [Fibrobacterota bacterium]